MNKTPENLLAAALVLSLLVPSFFFVVSTHKAHAQGAEVPVGDLKNTKVGIVRKIIAGKTLTEETIQTGTDLWQKLKEGVLDPLATTMAQAMIDQLTNSVVNWINSGFNGSPAFVTNPARFLRNIASQGAGEFINGTELGLLCDPFRLDVRLALSLNLSNRFEKKIRCTLDDIVANVKGAAGSAQGFLRGDFRAGGWGGWLAVSNYGGNNPYGAYLEAQSELGIRIIGRQNIEVKQLDWGRGFLSWKPCVNRETQAQARERIGDYESPGDVKTECLQYGNVQTPGSFIEQKFHENTGSSLRKLEMADEINEIVTALVNQLIVQVINGTAGLAGVGDEEFADESVFYDSPTVEGAVNTARQIPTCSGAARTTDPRCILRGEEEGSPDRSLITDRATTTFADGLVKEAEKSAPGELGSLQSNGEQQKGPTNLALGKPTGQSSTYISDGYFYYPGSDVAVDGMTIGTYNKDAPYGYSLTNNETHPYWQVTLAEPTEAPQPVERIRIYRESKNQFTNYDMDLFVTTTDFTDPKLSNAEELNRLRTGNGSNPAITFGTTISSSAFGSRNYVDISLPSPRLGRYVRIQKTNPGTAYLALVEVQVFGTTDANSPDIAVTPVTVRKEPLTTDGTFSGNFTITPNEDIANASIRVGLFEKKTDSDGGRSPESVFSEFSITGGNLTRETGEIVIPGTTGVILKKALSLSAITAPLPLPNTISINAFVVEPLLLTKGTPVTITYTGKSSRLQDGQSKFYLVFEVVKPGETAPLGSHQVSFEEAPPPSAANSGNTDGNQETPNP
ncbi:MAG: hypothetical protein G01um101472_8 [Parcubacteria group bacterium Gr01-1014_72]|nr:MAG: hypothetical protein G01um101472_8 [Parcubacteria group bacterium Gr01-1014_72]